MKKLLVALFVSLLLLGACSSSSDDAKDKVSTESSKDNSSDKTTTTDSSSSESSSSRNKKMEDLPRGMDSAVQSLDDQFNLDSDQEDCLIQAVLDDPDLANLDSTDVTSDPELFVQVLALLRDCVGDDQLAEIFAQGIADSDSSGSLTDADINCIAQEFVGFSDEVWGEIVLGGSDPTYTPSAATISALTDVFLNCDLDPTAFG